MGIPDLRGPSGGWGRRGSRVSGDGIASPFWAEAQTSRCPIQGSSTAPLPAPLRPLPVALRGSTAPLLSSTAHSQFVPLPPPTGLASPHPSPLKGHPPHPPPSSLSSWALAHPSGHWNKAQPLRLCTGSGLRFLPFRTQPPITCPLHRPISNHVPSALPQLISSAVLTPMDTRRLRRRRIYNCSLCTRGSWRGAGWGGGTPARALV